MHARPMTVVLAVMLALAGTTAIGAAQSARKPAKAPTPAKTVVAPAPPKASIDSGTVAAAAYAPENARIAADTAVPDTVHKKRGLMGKMKGLAKNKVVRQVAKVAACTVVPGGQFVAGAIDAGSAEGAAGAAQGVAGAATGSACMPGGMGGAAGMAGGVGAGVPGTGLPGAMPGGGMPAGAGGLSLTPEQMAALQASAASAPAGQMGSPAQMQQMMAPRMSAGGAMTEAPGQPVDLPADLAAALQKGRAAIRQIDWDGGKPTVSALGQPGFTEAMSRLSAAMAEGGGKYRVDIYLDARYDDAIVKTLGAQRLATVEATLAATPAAAGGAFVLELGKTKRDKDARLEFVKRK